MNQDLIGKVNNYTLVNNYMLVNIWTNEIVCSGKTFESVEEQAAAVCNSLIKAGKEFVFQICRRRKKDIRSTQRVYYYRTTRCSSEFYCYSYHGQKVGFLNARTNKKNR